ncbi:hypothetical protein BDZ89DRAFT_969271, partial [Hymenopellis radicata]
MDWTYFPEAYNGYIRAIIADNWPAEHVHALNDLFFKLGGHDFAKRGVLGKRALLAYCESMRRLWHNDFEAGRVSFNIGDINVTSLEAKYNEIIANESTAAIQTVCALFSLSRDSNAKAQALIQRLESAVRTATSSSPLSDPVQSPHRATARRHPDATLHAIFRGAQEVRSPSPVPSVWGYTQASHRVARQPFGMGARRAFAGAQRAASRPFQAAVYASTSRSLAAVPVPSIPTVTSAPAVETRVMVPTSVLELRRRKTLTPLKPDNWERLLSLYGLHHRYPHIVNGLRYGFNIGVP